jgi:cell division protein FtsN
MCKRLLLCLLLALITPAAFAKTALDLMLEGRFGEAKAILDTSNVSPRYQLLYFAMVESDAARACSLYQVVAIRYPASDCDTAARIRLDQAQDIGFVLMPIAEWSQAPQEVRPLALRRAPSLNTEAKIPQTEVAATTPETPAAVPSISIAVPLPSPPMPEVVAAPPVVEAKRETTASEVSVHDTFLPATNTAVIVETGIVDTGGVDTVLPNTPPVETPEPTPPPMKMPEPTPPPVSIAEQPAPEPIVENKKPEVPEPAVAAPIAANTTEVIPSAPVPNGNNHSVSNGHWYIQVGAFANYNNAHRLALRLQNAGFPIKLIPRDTAKGKLLQVRVGGYVTREELPALVDRLKSEFQVPTVIISE